MGFNWTLLKDVVPMLASEHARVEDIEPGDMLVDDFGLFGVARIERDPVGYYTFYDAYDNSDKGGLHGSKLERLVPALVRRDQVLEDAARVRRMIEREAKQEPS